ncbi:MAG TPA: DUF4055 domain-containing protein [Flavobacteriales bacterium]|nr:DUF4055 domain-containing protein [Methylococcaceae bacterium]HHZ95270.1 DUF4055 domain-containing protein [Flavobacteriales bacterium]
MAHNTQTTDNFLSGDSNYQEQFNLWQEVRAAIAGKYKVLQIITCLPGPQYKQYPIFGTDAQIQQAHACNAANALRVQSYWSRGRFFNATGRTHESLGGMVWSKEPEVELAPKLEYLEVNADGAGSGLREVAQATVDEVGSIGRYGILVDMPSNEQRLTQAQMQMPENAPRFIQYKAEQILPPRVSGNSQAVDEIKLIEITSVQKNEWEWEDVKQLRRLIMIDGVYHNQLWTEKKELISDVIPFANGAPLKEIPFQFFGADNNSPEYSKIPLYDLANANLGHFVLDCDNRDNLHFHGQGMTNVFTDMTTEEFAESNPNGLDVGAKGRNLFNAGDKVELLQLEATGAIPAEMERDQQRMVMLGAQLVTDNTSNETATAKRIDSNASTSVLKRISFNVTSGLEQCLEWAALFLGESKESTYKLNTDFVTDDMTPEMITKQMEMVQGGVLPKATLYETARKVGFTKADDETLAAEAEKDSAEIVGMTEQQAVAQAANEAE